MAVSKGKIVVGAAGGVAMVVACTLGYLLFSAYSMRQEAEMELSDGIDSFRRVNAAAVFPSRASIAAVATNKAICAGWLAKATEVAARGDRPVAQDESPASFKQRLTDEVRRLGSLPGGAAGRLAAPNFYFGFDRYLGESAVLPEAAMVPRLSVQLAAISRFAEIFAESGVLEVKSVRRLEPAVQENEPKERRASARRNKKEQAADAEVPKTTSLEYAVSILARPPALVEVLNALTADTRFTVVKNFAFHSTGDMIVERLNAAEALLAKKNEPQNNRRRRRRAFAEEANETAAPKGDDRLVVDPELDAPLQVDMTLVVYDFGRAAVAEAPAGEGAAVNQSAKGEVK